MQDNMKGIENKREPLDTLGDNINNSQNELSKLLVPAIICLTSAIIVSLTAVDLHSGHHTAPREAMDLIGITGGLISTYLSAIILLGRSGMSL